MFQRCSAMLDLLPAIIAYVDRDLRYAYANATHLAWTGRAGDDYVGRHLWEGMSPAIRALVEPVVARVLAGEEVEVEFALPPGFRQQFVRLTAIPDRDPAGAVIGMLMLTADMSERHRLEERLRRSEATFHNAFEAAAVGKALVDLDGRCIEVNAAFAAMLGYDRATLKGMTFAALTHAADLAADLDQFEAVKRGEIDRYELEKRYLHRDGHVIHALLSVAVVRDEARAPLFFVSQMIDISATKAAERRLRDSNARLMLAMEVLEGGVWGYDIATGTVDISDGLARVFGFDTLGGPVPTDELNAIIHPDDRAGASLAALAAGEEERSTALFRITAANGRTRWIRDRRQLIRDEAGRPAQLLGVAVDVTAERADASRLEREAVTDPLTGLLNRRGLEAAADRLLAGCAGTGRVALMLLDLDRFKPINDDLGHAAGDAVLREVARRITGQLRATDVIARPGGDEFAVVLPCGDIRAAERAAARIVAALAVPYTIGGVTVMASASLGIAIAEPGCALATLTERADAALYEVKRSGRGRWAMAA